MVELFERLISTDPATGKWDQKLNDADVKVWIKLVRTLN